MNLFKTLGDNLSYKDILQVDGAFSTAHANYGRSPKFNAYDGADLAGASRSCDLPSSDDLEELVGRLRSFDGTATDYTRAEQLELWRAYWIEYIHAFDRLIEILPESVVTVYIGRHAIEIGLKYLLLQNTGEIARTHNLEVLSNKLDAAQLATDGYMQWVSSFCSSYCSFIEGNNPEYFRFPAYKKGAYFAGNHLDIRWLSYNFALIILKLLHLADLEKEFEQPPYFSPE